MAAEEWTGVMGEIIRNIILFLLVGAVLLVGILYVISEINSPGSGLQLGLAAIPATEPRL
jgi:hypothetical protein